MHRGQYGAPRGILLEKKQVEGFQEARAVGGAGGNTEFPGYTLKKLGGRKTGVENQGRSVMIGIKLAEECTQDRRFPRSHLSRQGNKSCPIVNPVQQVGKGFPVVLAQEDKAWVGGQVKRLFAEAIKVEVHRRVPLKNNGILL